MAKDESVIEVDRAVPYYDAECCVCGNGPIVCFEKDGEIIHSTDMCGPCTFGEARMIDPDLWND